MNFAMTIPANVVDIGVTVVALTPFRPGFVRDVQIQVTNHGGMPVDSFYLYFDVLQQLPELEYIGALPTPYTRWATRWVGLFHTWAFPRWPLFCSI